MGRSNRLGIYPLYLLVPMLTLQVLFDKRASIQYYIHFKAHPQIPHTSVSDILNTKVLAR